MPEQQLREIIETMRARIQAELDAQLQAFAELHQQTLERARSEADAEAEQRWASRVEAIRAEWSARLDSEVTVARSDAEKRLVAESMRVRVEAEQTAAEIAGAQRRELELAVATERQRAEVRLEAERQRAEQELQQTLAALEAERQLTESQQASNQDTDASAILSAVQSIDAATSLSDTLTALSRAAAAQGARATLFVVNGNRLDEWNAPDVPSLSAGPFRVDTPESGLLREAVERGCAVSSTNDSALALPSFARLPAGSGAVAIPIAVGDQVVAVLYGDDGGQERAGSWRTALGLLGHHASACVTRLTAVRALQLVQRGSGASLSVSSAPQVSEDDQSARRYARLLVSEIKLYNEGAVRLGRENRDLLKRLKTEIERARRMYEARVSPAVTARGFYFHQELVQTLAGGDPGLLGV